MKLTDNKLGTVAQNIILGSMMGMEMVLTHRAFYRQIVGLLTKMVSMIHYFMKEYPVFFESFGAKFDVGYQEGKWTIVRIRVPVTEE